MRLSCAEIRRLFWQLVLAVERSAAAILRWSWWRRTHQAWARYYHYRRREEERRLECNPEAREAAEPSAEGVVEEGGVSEMAEAVWRCLERLLPTDKRSGRPYSHERRRIVEAIVYQRRTGCGWNALPSDYPPYQTVHTQLRNWQKSGLWDIAWNESLEQSRPTE